MNQTEILRILKNGAEKPIDKLNDFTHGKSSGEMQAYSHAYTLVKNLSIYGVVDLLIAWEKFKKDNWYESDAIDVEKMLMKQFEAIYNS